MTESGPEWLSIDIPKQADDVEQWMSDCSGPLSANNR